MAAQAFYALLPRLYKRGRQLAWTLSGGEQQMLALHVAHGRKLKEHLPCPAAFLSRSDVL